MSGSALRLLGLAAGIACAGMAGASPGTQALASLCSYSPVLVNCISCWTQAQGWRDPVLLGGGAAGAQPGRVLEGEGTGPFCPLLTQELSFKR